MERPTFVSSGPDAMGRTVCFGDERSRKARYGRIRPMPVRSNLPVLYRKPLLKRISAWFRLSC